ncbi:S1C family serine protease [Arthrobacter sp. HY1533]|uniref:S1C family serine protease n=1 Tax=Arthrobacter sp. HY1533 TaxID=2970919 RepID=UPI0022B9EC05|nr:trypsin-like peptidase domain-containing protein [Arthrobacter sp. HY1533]
MSENNGEQTTNNGELQHKAPEANQTPAAEAATPAPSTPAAATPAAETQAIPGQEAPAAAEQAPAARAQWPAAREAEPAANRWQAPAAQAPVAQSGTGAPAGSPTEPIPATEHPTLPIPSAYGAPAAPNPAANQNPYGAPAPQGRHGAPAPYGAPAASQNPTERIPGVQQENAGSGTTPQAAAQPGQPAHQANGHAGPGYPASNAYPHALAPAVTAVPKERRKVGLGLFAGSVVAAALVGGLVAGGSMALMGQTGSNGAAPSSQSAPLVVNNTNSVNQVTAAAAKAMPSVVTISATSGNSGGTGSGIILNTDGYILTNTHVVTLDGAAAHAKIEVQTSDNKVYAGTIVGTDPLSDLAVIKIDAPDLVPATLGESGKINVGDTVIAIGSPLGLDNTVTDGIVSTLNRTIQVASSAVPETPSDSSQTPDDSGNGFRFSPPGGGQDTTAAQGTVNLNVIQTDAAINPGNSGGALVNAQGEVIGVNVAIASTGSSSGSGSQGGNIGVGFSIPIDHAKQVAEQIIKTGKATHGQLGVTVSGTSATGTDSAFSSGATVQNVTAGSAGAKAGIKKGDVITQLGNRTISDAADLTAAVREQPGGATVKLNFTRDGKAQSVDVTLDTMPAS